MASPILQFDATAITTIGFLFAGETTAVASDCNGSIAVETEVQTIEKKCGQTVVASKSKPTKMTVTVNAKVPVEVFRRVNGIKPMDELKEGVYAYGANGGERFTLTVELLDDFTDETKLIAFPMVALSNGLAFEIENGADEVADLEIETTAYQDDRGQWYYEAFPTEATTVDPVEWLTNFTDATVKKPSAVTGITISPKTATVAVGDKTNLSATVAPSTANQNVTYESSDVTKATVTNTGEVTGIAVGTATITVKAVGDTTKTDTATITIEA